MEALSFIKEIFLSNAGSFASVLAPDSDKLSELKKTVREFKAWSEVIDEADQLNLDRVQDPNMKAYKHNFPIWSCLSLYASM